MKFLLLSCLFLGSLYHVQAIDAYLQDISKSLKMSPEEVLHEMRSMLDEHYFHSSPSPTPKGAKCVLCTTVFDGFIEFLHLENLPQLLERIIGICKTFNIYPDAVCEGAVYAQGPLIIDLLKQVEDHHPFRDEMCSMFAKDICGSGFDPEAWLVELPDVPKPPVEDIVMPTKDVPTLKIAHFSDIHLDRAYIVGGQTECGDPICCETNHTSGYKAGQWGSYWDCDTPVHTFETMMKHISDNHKDVDVVVFGGDIPSHDIWKQSKDLNLDIAKKGYAIMSKYFADWNFIPTLGNHESHPLNCVPNEEEKNPDYDIAWLYDEIKTQWSQWIPKDSIAPGLCFSKQISEGFRIVSFNSIYGYNMNWFSYMTETDPGGILTWLANELQDAETAGDKVHILTHIPSGGESTRYVWSHNLHRILNRYEGTVRAMYLGHTHYDDFKLLFDAENKTRAFGINYVVGGTTPESEKNPSYRIYTVDGDHEKSTHMVLNYETWGMNLTAANMHENVPPTWEKFFDAKSAYSLDSLTPENWYGVIKKSAEDDDYFKHVYYKHRGSLSAMLPDCDADCKHNVLCEAVLGDSSDTYHCDLLP